MMPITSEVRFDAQMMLLHSMMTWIQDQLKMVKLSRNELKKVELALEEALVNIISYAYKKPGGPIDLTFHYHPGKELFFMIKDRGVPFNPIHEESEMEYNMPIEEREEGGLGIPMIHKLMDHVEYERLEDTNVLILKKKCA